MTRESIRGYGFSSDDAQLVAVGFFLGDDCRGSSIDWYREWAYDPKSDMTGGNISTVRKIEDKVEISWDIDETGETSFLISMDKFRHLLNVWHDMEAMHPKKVRISIKDTDDVELKLLETFQKIPKK